MFDSTILEIAIGLVFIYALLSLMVTSLTEIWAGFVKTRTRNLKDGLKNLLDPDPTHSTAKGYISKQNKIGGIFEEFMDSSTIRTLFATLPHAGTGVISKTRSFIRPPEPSHIEANKFTRGILEISNVPAISFFVLRVTKEIEALAASSTNVGPVALNVNDLQEAGALKKKCRQPIAKLIEQAGRIESPKKSAEFALAGLAAAEGESVAMAIQDKFADHEVGVILNKLLVESGFDMESFRKKVDDWFDDVMDRVSGWFRRKTQLITVLVATFVTLSLNVDTIVLLHGLSENDALRETLVARAEAAVDGGSNRKPTPIGEGTGPAKPGISGANSVDNAETTIAASPTNKTASASNTNAIKTEWKIPPNARTNDIGVLSKTWNTNAYRTAKEWTLQSKYSAVRSGRPFEAQFIRALSDQGARKFVFATTAPDLVKVQPAKFEFNKNTGKKVDLKLLTQPSSVTTEFRILVSTPGLAIKTTNAIKLIASSTAVSNEARRAVIARREETKTLKKAEAEAEAEARKSKKQLEEALELASDDPEETYRAAKQELLNLRLPIGWWTWQQLAGTTNLATIATNPVVTSGKQFTVNLNVNQGGNTNTTTIDGEFGEKPIVTHTNFDVANLQKRFNDTWQVRYSMVKPVDSAGNPKIPFFDSALWRAHFLGWLMTIAAISLGAPFWFDMLSKLVRIRSSGAVKSKPKSDSNKSADGDGGGPPSGGLASAPIMIAPSSPDEPILADTETALDEAENVAAGLLKKASPLIDQADNEALDKMAEKAALAKLMEESDVLIFNQGQDVEKKRKGLQELFDQDSPEKVRQLKNFVRLISP
jgi:hypothetical protein